MAYSHTYKEWLAEQILSVIGEGSKPCREIADQIGVPQKTAYRHLRFMAEVLGTVRKEQVPAANGGECKIVLWAQVELEMPGEPKRVIRSDWPRGEHKRDAMLAAFFGTEQYSGEQRGRADYNSVKCYGH